MIIANNNFDLPLPGMEVQHDMTMSGIVAQVPPVRAAPYPVRFCAMNPARKACDREQMWI